MPARLRLGRHLRRNKGRPALYRSGEAILPCPLRTLLRSQRHQLCLHRRPHHPRSHLRKTKQKRTPLCVASVRASAPDIKVAVSVSEPYCSRGRAAVERFCRGNAPCLGLHIGTRRSESRLHSLSSRRQTRSLDHLWVCRCLLSCFFFVSVSGASATPDVFVARRVAILADRKRQSPGTK